MALVDAVYSKHKISMNQKIFLKERESQREREKVKLNVCRQKNKGMCIKRSSCYHIHFVARRKRKREKSKCSQFIKKKSNALS